MLDFSNIGRSDCDFLSEYYEIIKEIEALGKIVFVTGLIKKFIECEFPIYDQKWIGDFKKQNRIVYVDLNKNITLSNQNSQQVPSK